MADSSIIHIDSFGRQMEQLQPNDHLCLFYEEADDWKHIVIPFITSGLEKNEKCIYILEDQSEPEVRTYLDEMNYDLHSKVETGQFVFLTTVESYFRDQHFDPECMIEFVQQQTLQAQAEGYDALRMTGELSWVANYPEITEQIIEYEIGLNEQVFPMYPVIGLCRYNLNRLDPSLVKKLIKVHPYIIWKGRFHENPYYLPPEGFVGPDNTRYEVNHWLENMRDFNKKEGRFLKKIEDQEKEFQTLFNHIQDSIILFSVKDGSPEMIREVNRIACSRLGYSRAELLQMTLLDIICDQSFANEFNQINTELIETGRSTFEITFVTRKGQKIQVEMNAHLFTFQGETVILGVTRDISERKKEKQRLEESYALLKTKLGYEKLKNEFFISLSHEFRTPLNLMFSALQLLQLKAKKDPAIERYVHILRQNSYRLLKLVNNLLDITKLKSGTFKLQLQNHDIVTMVRQVTESVEEYVRAQDKQIKFYSNVERKVMAIDAMNMERVILNLLSNAVKSTRPQDQIQVLVEDQGGMVTISIKDTGAGIKEEMQEKIFEQFCRVDESLIRSHEGTGLGLWIVKSLVELHEGKVNLCSTYGEGSEFSVQLPVFTLADQETHDLDTNHDVKELIDRLKVEFSDIYDL